MVTAINTAAQGQFLKNTYGVLTGINRVSKQPMSHLAHLLATGEGIKIPWGYPIVKVRLFERLTYLQATWLADISLSKMNLWRKYPLTMTSYLTTNGVNTVILPMQFIDPKNRRFRGHVLLLRAESDGIMLRNPATNEVANITDTEGVRKLLKYAVGAQIAGWANTIEKSLNEMNLHQYISVKQENENGTQDTEEAQNQRIIDRVTQRLIAQAETQIRKTEENMKMKKREKKAAAKAARPRKDNGKKDQH